MAKHVRTITECRNYYLAPHFPVLLLTGEHWKISNVPSDRLHFHNCLEIGICHSDSGCMEFYGETIPFKEGDVTFIPRNVSHTTYSDPGVTSHWSYLFVDPKGLLKNSLPPAWENFDLQPFRFQNFQYILSREQYPAVYQLVMLLIEELREEKPGYQFTTTGLMLALYIEIFRIQSEEREEKNEKGGDVSGEKMENTEDDFSHSSTPLPIAPALDYIENNYMKQFSMEFLAGLCHWSPTHFRRIFQSVMRISPLNYVNHTRIQKSCSLLCSTEDSILSISEAVGFQSVSSYNRYFVRIMQMSPREYRRQMLQSDKQAVQNMSILEYSGWMYPEE